MPDEAVGKHSSQANVSGLRLGQVQSWPRDSQAHNVEGLDVIALSSVMMPPGNLGTRPNTA